MQMLCRSSCNAEDAALGPGGAEGEKLTAGSEKFVLFFGRTSKGDKGSRLSHSICTTEKHRKKVQTRETAGFQLKAPKKRMEAAVLVLRPP